MPEFKRGPVRRARHADRRWFIKSGEVEAGPLEIRHLQDLVDRQLLRTTDLVRAEDLTEWRPLGTVSVASRLRWPGKASRRRQAVFGWGGVTKSPPTDPGGHDEPKSLPRVAPGKPAMDQTESRVLPGLNLIDRAHLGILENARIALRGLSIVLIALGVYEAGLAMRTWFFPADSPFLGIAFYFAVLCAAAVWITSDTDG